MGWDSEQRAVAKAAALALAVTITMLLFAVLSRHLERVLPNQRPALFALALAPLAFALLQNIAMLARHRFFSVADREAAARAGEATPKAAMLSAILRNTHEQVTLAAVVYAIAAIALSAQLTDAIIGSAMLFLIGRLVFAARYAKGAGARAFGFGLTFYPTIALALLTAITVLV